MTTKDCRICFNTYDSHRLRCSACGAVNLGQSSYIAKDHRVLSFVRAHGAVSAGHFYGTVIRFESCDQEQSQ